MAVIEQNISNLSDGLVEDFITINNNLSTTRATSQKAMVNSADALGKAQVAMSQATVTAEISGELRDAYTKDKAQYDSFMRATLTRLRDAESTIALLTARLAALEKK